MGIDIRMGLTGARVGGGGGANPLTAALAWVDAGADGALIGPTSPRWQDSAQTTPWAADGDPVGYVEDLSRFASDLSQGTPGNRPTGHVGYLLNNGTSSFLQGPNKAPKAGWYFAVAAMVPGPGGAAGVRTAFGIGIATAANRMTAALRGDGATRTAQGTIRLNAGTAYVQNTTLAWTDGVPFTFEVWADGVDLFQSVDGATPTTVAAPVGVDVGVSTALQLFEATTVPARIYAAIARDGLPTGSDRANVILPYLDAVTP